MLTVLGGLADVERDLIRTCTAEGRSRATARGQHMGQPSSLTVQQAAEARQRRQDGATLKNRDARHQCQHDLEIKAAMQPSARLRHA